MRDIPELSMETIRRMADMTWFTHARIFDDLLIVAQKETACYVWKTAAGLVVFDAIWPDERAFDAIVSAIEDAGWARERVAKLVMTHGHIDHVGCGRELVERCGAAAFLSEADDALRRATPHEDGRPDGWKEFPIDCFLRDGERLDCGGRDLLVIATPGHTAGCMSFIFPVSDSGEAHMACLFGGATAPWGDDAGKEAQRRSVKKFKAAARANGCDVALTNHTAFDNGLERIAYSRARLSCLPNIYVLGTEGVQRYCEVFERVIG